MAKSSKKSRRQEPPAPLAEPVPRDAARNGGSEAADPRAADQGSRSGHIARVEQLTVQRVRQIVAAVKKREANPPVELVQFQMARVGEAMSLHIL
jgi:hypothetical protein